MRTLFLYIVYLIVAFILMFLFYIDYFPSISETIMATVMLWCFIYAANITYVVGFGKLLRRQIRNEKQRIVPVDSSVSNNNSTIGDKIRRILWR